MGQSPQTSDLECGTCHVSYPIEIWIIIDREERPDLWEYCRDGSIHTVECPNGHSMYLGVPLLLIDAAHKRNIYSPFGPPNQPADQPPTLQQQQEAIQLMGMAQASL